MGCINGVSSRSDWDHSVHDITANFEDVKARPLAAIRQEMHNTGVKIFDEVETDVMFGIKMVGVDPSLRGKGMSTDIIRRSILLAGCLGFTGLKAEATAAYAQAAFLTIGFKPVAEILYKDFEFNGEKVFEGIEGETGLILFQKKFFQNCLKHIVRILEQSSTKNGAEHVNRMSKHTAKKTDGALQGSYKSVWANIRT